MKIPIDSEIKGKQKQIKKMKGLMPVYSPEKRRKYGDVNHVCRCAEMRVRAIFIYKQKGPHHSNWYKFDTNWRTCRVGALSRKALRKDSKAILRQMISHHSQAAMVA